MKEILRYLAYHLLRQLDGRGGIRGYYRALLGDVQLVKIHSYPKHIPARGCIVRVRHSWNVRIIFYRDPFFFFFFFFSFFFFFLRDLGTSDPSKWRSWPATTPNLLHFSFWQSFHFVAEKLKNEFFSSGFPRHRKCIDKIDVSDLNYKYKIILWISAHISKEKSISR